MPGMISRKAPVIPKAPAPSAPITKRAPQVAQRAPQVAKRAPVQSIPRAQSIPQQQPSPPPIQERNLMSSSPMTGFSADAGGGFDPGLSGGLSGLGGISEPVAPTIPDVNSEETYQMQKAELARVLADYQAQNGLVTGQYDTNFNDGLRKLGWNGAQGGFDAGNMQGLYGQALGDNANDFAARGLRSSGLFADSNSQLNNNFADRKTGIDTARTQFMDTQNLGMQQFQAQNSLSADAAKREAVARMAAKYGVSLNAIPQGQ